MSCFNFEKLWEKINSVSINEYEYLKKNVMTITLFTVINIGSAHHRLTSYNSPYNSICKLVETSIPDQNESNLHRIYLILLLIILPLQKILLIQSPSHRKSWLRLCAEGTIGGSRLQKKKKDMKDWLTTWDETVFRREWQKTTRCEEVGCQRPAIRQCNKNIYIVIH